MIRIVLDLGPLEDFPTNALPGFTDQLLTTLPSLVGHGCSLHRPGGFVERLTEGTWLGHVVEHVALELQTLAGHPVERGKTRSVPGRPGVYNAMFAYRDETVGLAAGRLALELVAGILPPSLTPVVGLDILHGPLERTVEDGPVPGMQTLVRLAARSALGPTTRSLVDAARERRIPVERLDNVGLIRLGHGHHQTLLGASITGQTSHLGVELAGDKQRAKSLLAAAGIPVPHGVVVATTAEALKAAASIGFPVVTKPLNGNHGRGVSLSLTDQAAVRRGFEAAAAHGDKVIVERHWSGRDYRILVVDGRVVAAAERTPAHVVGNGEDTIAELIAKLNKDPRRGMGHEKVLTRVRVDKQLHELLAAHGLTVNSVPAPRQVVMLRATANLSAGGTATDRTDEIHPSNRAIAERAARIIGLDIAGLDVISPDITKPLTETGGGIIEVNAAPGFRMHLEPSSGQARDVAGPVIDMLYPRAVSSRIPITAVTGTNGKTTVTRMLGHIFEHSGKSVGMTTTSGIYVGGQLIQKGDASGPRSARLVLGDPTVEVAVLETARGGILREGLAFDRADVGIVLNISADHLGLKGVETLHDLALVKSVVVRQVRRGGTSVLNTDDAHTLRMARRANGRVAYFTARSRESLSPMLQQHLVDGGVVATIEDSAGGELLTINTGPMSISLLAADEVPATLGGAASFNVQNALAAALAAFVQGVEPGVIAEALRGFSGSFEQNPGRLNVTRAPGFTAIVDYAHNPAALQAIGDVVTNLRPHHDRVIGVVSIPGDRRDADILEMGRLSAGIFDYVIFRELPDGRGRSTGDVIGLLSVGAIGAGMRAENVLRIPGELAAVEAALRMAGPRDLVLMMPTDIDGVWGKVQAFRHDSAAFAEERSTRRSSVPTATGRSAKAVVPLRSG